MNQILYTDNNEWIEENEFIKEQKSIYKAITILVIVLVCVLIIGIAVYAFNSIKKSRNNNVAIPIVEKIETPNQMESKSSLEEELYNEEDVVYRENVTHNGIKYEKIVLEEEIEMPEPEVLYSASGDSYSYIGSVIIEKINLDMPIISKTTEELMSKSACKLWGPDPNRVGNFCIIGHNWRNTKLFSKVPTLEIGDTFKITDLSGRTIEYEIYEKYIVYPEDTECLNQETEGRREATLITCTNDSTQRYILHATEI